MGRIESYLERSHSKEIIEKVVLCIDGDPERFKELFYCFTQLGYRMTQRASWAISATLERWPELIAPYHSELIALLAHPEKHPSIRRNILRAYQWAEIPEEIEGELYDLSMRFLQDHDEAIAVRVFSMTVAFRMVSRYPDLAQELHLAIDQAMPHASAGMRSRGSKITKQLQKFL